MKTFKLHRDKDISGVSGTGDVAEGVIFHDGEVGLSWFGPRHCVSVWDNIEDVIAVHGHDGLTKVVWDE